MNKLPFEMCRRWVRESVCIKEHTGRVAQFEDLVKFVKHESSEVNSLFGRRVFTTKPETKSASQADRKKLDSTSYSSFSVETENYQSKQHGSSPKCWFCQDKAHFLHDCSAFAKLACKERSEFVKPKGLCYKRLSSKHKTGQCKRTNICKVQDCTGTFHHTLLHKPKRSPNEQVLRDGSKDSKHKDVGCDKEEINDNHSVVTCAQLSNNVYRCVVRVLVYHGTIKVRTYAFLDQGSTHTFCDRKQLKTLDISRSPETINLQTLGQAIFTYQVSTCSLHVSAIDGEEAIELPKVFSMDELPIRPNLIPAKENLKAFSHLRDLTFPKVEGATVTLLIGADNPELFCPMDTCKDKRGEPIAVETPLGWSLLEPSLSPSGSRNCSVNFVAKYDKSPARQLEQFWTNEFEAGTSILTMPSSREDRETYKLLQENVKHVKKHYQLPLPLRRQAAVKLRNNREMALRRLVSLKNCFLRNPMLKGG